MNERNAMDNLEKVEKLRARANISYEEAKEALEQANGDLLDAMVALERSGKTAGTGQSAQSGATEDEERFETVSDRVRVENDDAGERFSNSLKRFFRTIGAWLMENSLILRRNGEQIFSIPVWVALIIVLVTWEWIWIAIIVSFFFNCRYAFEGRNRNENANEILNRASDLADNVKKEFHKNE